MKYLDQQLYQYNDFSQGLNPKNLMQSWAHWLWGHCTSVLLISRCAFNFLFYLLLDFENKLKRKIQYGDADEVSRISPKDLTKCNSNALFMAMKVREFKQFYYWYAFALSCIKTVLSSDRPFAAGFNWIASLFFLTNQVLGCVTQNPFFNIHHNLCYWQVTYDCFISCWPPNKIESIDAPFYGKFIIYVLFVIRLVFHQE